MGIQTSALKTRQQRTFVWFVAGDIGVADQQSLTLFNKKAIIPKSVKLYAETAPTGSALICDIDDDGVSIFSTNPQIAISENEGGDSAVISAASIAADSKLTLNVDQIGSTIAGADLTVELHCIEP